ncbi:hypothetical protein GCM10009805_15030 [Leucobacter chromiireducens subsp. solipictus]
MGRVWRREVVAIRCEIRSCQTAVQVPPEVPSEQGWSALAPQLRAMVKTGWAVVLTQKFRTYCPLHAARARECTCRTHPSRKHLCVVHTADAAALVWDEFQIPTDVSFFLEAIS